MQSSDGGFAGRDRKEQSPISSGHDDSHDGQTFTQARAGLGSHNSPQVLDENKAFSQSTQPIDSHTDNNKAPSPDSQWGIDWKTPALTAALFFCGLAFALGHHFYYNALNGESNTSKSSQEWAVRIGLGLAFLARGALVSAAGLAYEQYTWLRLKGRPMTLRGIDGLFAALTNFSALADFHSLRQAPINILLAMLIWCIPLSAIFPPAALTVVPSLRTKILEVKVPELTWSLLPSLYGGFGYWAGAGQDLYRLATTTAYGMSVLPMVPLHANYSYDLEFLSPALKCGRVWPEQQATFDRILGENWEQVEGRGVEYFAYHAVVPYSTYNLSDPATDLTAFRNELWIRTTTENFTCQTWNVSYTAKFEFQNGAQSLMIMREDLIEQFVPKTAHYEVAGGIDPPEAFGYRSWLEVITSLLEGEARAGGPQLKENITTKALNTGLLACPEMKSVFDLFEKGGAVAPLVFDYYCRNNSLATAIEDLARNFTFSLFGYTKALQKENDTALRPITITTAGNVYAYSAKTLLASYFAGIAVTLIILIFGVYALLSNGVVHSSDFSGMLFATRNPDLDTLAYGWNMATKPLDSAFAKVKLQFGMIQDGGIRNGGSKEQPAEHDGIHGLKTPVAVHMEASHAAFGLEGTVTQIRKRNNVV